MSIQDRIKAVQKNIADSCLQVKRDSTSVTLIAVSKTKPAGDIIAAADAGISNFGENYLQEAIPKIEFLRTYFPANKQITWHYLGRLQSRKLKTIARYFTVLHSLDRIDHAQKLNDIVQEKDKKIRVFIQVNLDNEPQKGGVLTNEIDPFIENMQLFENIEVLGLMLIPKPDTAEKTFAKFQELKHISTSLGEKTRGCLSMGMSADYSLALQAGATHIRIGTAIFDKRD